MFPWPLPDRSVIIVADWFPSDKTEALRREHKGRTEYRISRRMFDALTVQHDLDGVPVELERLPPTDFIGWLLGGIGVALTVTVTLLLIAPPGYTWLGFAGIPVAFLYCAIRPLR